MPRPFLYTYVPKSAEIGTQGLRSISTLNGDEWKKYCGRAGSTKKEDVLKWLEKTIPGRTKGICVFTQPIPDNAPPAILAFRDSHRRVTIKSFDELKKDGIITACYAENLKWEPNTRQLEWIPVDHPDWNEKLIWDGSNPKLLFVKTEHYLIITKDGVIPPKYLMYSRSSNEDYGEEALAEKAIKNGYLYHGSPRKLDKLAAAASETADAMGSVCVTPCKGLAYCFAIDKDAVLGAVEKQFARRVLKCNFGYDIWNKPVSELYKAPKNITIELNIRGIKPIHGKSVGYIYTIDFSKYKDKCHMYHNSDVEIAIKGDVDYIKREKVEVNWTCVSSELAIKHHGEGQLGTSDLGRESGEALMIHKWSMDEIFIHKASDITDEQWKLITESVNLAARASKDELWTEEEVKNKILRNKLEVYFFLQHRYNASKIDRSFTETYHPLGVIQFNPKTMFITNFAIFKKAQGQGVGFLALKKFMMYIKSRYPNKDIYINVASSNKAAKALYNKVGFTELSEENDACRMVYKLGHEETSTEALRRTWTIADIKSIDDLKQFYKTCRYSLVDWKADKCWKETHKNTAFEDWEKEWKLLTPEQIIKYRCGICYDTAMMSKYFLDKWGIQNQFYFGYTKRSKSDDYNDDPTHTFVIYKDQDKWKWLEGSWGPFKDNDWAESDPNTLIRNIGKALANSSHQTNLIARVTKFPNYGVSMANFYHFLKSQIYNPQFEIDPDPKYAKESFMSEYATISFPKEEIPTISKQSRIITTRVSSDYNKYHVGDMVQTPWDKIYKVTNRIEIKNVKDHPYYKELTKEQIEFLKNYDEIAVLTLELQSDSEEEYYYGMNPEDYIPDDDPMSELKKKAMGHPVDEISFEALSKEMLPDAVKSKLGKYLYHGTHRDLDISQLAVHFCKNRANLDIKAPVVYMTRSLGLACLHCAEFMKGHASNKKNYREHFVEFDKAKDSDKIIKHVEIVHNDPSLPEASGENDGFIYCTETKNCIDKLYFSTPKDKNDYLFVSYSPLPVDKKIKIHITWHRKFDENFAKEVKTNRYAGVESFTYENVSMEENTVQEEGTYVLIRGFPVAAFFKQLSKHYQTHKLENLIHVVHSIGISQWTVNTRTVKIHRFFLPEIVYLLNKFNMSQTLIGDIQRGSWMGAPITNRTDCKMERVNANMNCTLMAHQEKFVKDYADLKDYHRLRGYLLSFGQGLGKTITAIALMEALNKERVIVICPKNTMVETWKSHFQRFYKKEQSIYVAGFDKKFNGERFCIFNYDAIDKLNALDGVKKSKMGIIVDESHNFLRIEAARTRKLIDLAKSSEDADVLLVSGTPIKSNGKELIPLISMLDPLFDDEAAKIFKDSFGVNTKIASEVLHARLKRMMERVTKDALNLPPKRRSVIKVKIPDGQKYTIKAVKHGMKIYIDERLKFHRDHMVEYRQEFDECMRYLATRDIAKTPEFQRYRTIIERLVKHGGRFDQGDEDVAWANAYEKTVVEREFPSELLHKFRHCKAAIKYLHLKVRGEVLGQYLAKLRIEMTTAMLKSVNIKQLIDEAEKKTIIFSSFIDTIETCEQYVRSLGYKPIVIYGKNSNEIAPLAAKFQKDQTYNPLIASLQTLSTGATLTAANRVIFLNKPWRSIDYEQASDRVHRIGQDTAVDIISLVLDTGEEGNLSTRMEDIMDASARAFDAIVEEKKQEEDKKLRESREDYMFDQLDLPDDIIDEQNISFEGMTLLNDTHEQRVLNRLAKPHYRPKGQNSWEHVQQDMANGILLIKEIKHRDLTLQEYATILWHDSACKSIYPEKIGHGAKGAEIAKRDLKKTGFFTDKEIDEIYVAICEHDETSNPKNLHSSDLSDFLASADFNPMDIPWMLNKSYSWGIRHGKTHEACIENVMTHMPKTYGSEGCIVYPKLYSAYHKSRIKKLQEFFDDMTKEQCEQIITDYRKKHRLTPRDIRLPDPDAESTTLGFDKEYSVEELSFEGMSQSYASMQFANNPNKKKIWNLCKKYYDKGGSHGLNHIQEVMATAYVLKGKKDLTDMEYAAIAYHDVGRPYETKTRHHNAISVAIAKKELPTLGIFTNEQLAAIYKAILHHSNTWRKSKKIGFDQLDEMSALVAYADRGFPQTSYYEICLRPTLWILEGRDKKDNPAKMKRLNNYRTVDDIAQGVYETLEDIKDKRHDPNENSIYSRAFARERARQNTLRANISVKVIKPVVIRIMRDHGYTKVAGTEALSMESLEPSMEAANIKAKRKKVQDYILNAMKLLDPHTDTNTKYWKNKFESMNDKEFDQFMHYLREGKTNIHMFVPPFKVTLQTREMINAAHKLGVKIMHRIWMHDPHTGIKYLTPEEYMVLQLPVRRQQQFLDEKLSVPDNDKTIDGLTGQVTGDSKSCSITNPEVQILHARNLDATLYEFANVRGGNIRNYAEFKRSLEETGAVKLEQLDPTNRTRVAVMGQVLLTAMHLDVNLVDI